MGRAQIVFLGVEEEEGPESSNNAGAEQQGKWTVAAGSRLTDPNLMLIDRWPCRIPYYSDANRRSKSGTDGRQLSLSTHPCHHSSAGNPCPRCSVPISRCSCEFKQPSTAAKMKRGMDCQL